MKPITEEQIRERALQLASTTRAQMSRTIPDGTLWDVELITGIALRGVAELQLRLEADDADGGAGHIGLAARKLLNDGDYPVLTEEDAKARLAGGPARAPATALDKHPGPWSLCTDVKFGRLTAGQEVRDANGAPIIWATPCGVRFAEDDEGVVMQQVLSAPETKRERDELLEGLKALADDAERVFDDQRCGFVTPESLAAARALIAEIEKDHG